MANDPNKSGTLYDSSMGDDVKHGNVHFGGGEDGKDHHTYAGDGWHRSYDTDDNGNVSNDHTTIHWDGGNEVVEGEK